MILSAQEVQKALNTALDFLQAGQEEQAQAELKAVLQTDPGNKLALSLMRQINEDPMSMLGRDFFNYKVQPGESLSAIAKKYMGDLHLFYALARYNGIKVPRTLAGGQMIKVPGKAPTPSSLPPPPPPPPAPPPPPPPPPPPDQSDKQKADAIARYSREARAALARQDLDGALRNWNEVLKIDPKHAVATLERQKVIDLKKNLDQQRAAQPPAKTK